MIQKIRNSRFAQGFALYLAFTLIAELIQPSMALALTGGPSQPEVESFTPIGTTEMVDLSSGSFNYNIPLLDVGGYPINIAYNSGVTMDQEASWVGLGWNINPGVINRNLRGLPDDFDGDIVDEEFNMRPNFTAGISVNPDLEIFGFEPGSTFDMGLGFGLGVNWNNYNGFFITKSLGPSFKFGESNKFGFGLGLSSSTNDGVSVNPSVSYSKRTTEQSQFELMGGKLSSISEASVGGGIGASWNSRQGLKELTVNFHNTSSLKVKSGERTIYAQSEGGGIGSSMSFAASTYTPAISFPMQNISMSFTGKLGIKFFGAKGTLSLSGYFSNQWLKDEERSSPAYGYLNMRKWQNNSKNAISDFNREKSTTYIQGTTNIGFSYLTNDMFSVLGQGIGGQFRPYHNSIGYNHDPKFVSSGGGGKGGVEFGAGNLTEGGFSVVLNYSRSASGNWDDSKNLALKKLGYEAVNSSTDDREGVYFKNFGDLSVDNEYQRFNDLGGFQPIRVLLEKKALSTTATSNFVDKNGLEYEIGDNFKRNERVKRNQSIGYLSKNEIALGGLDDYTSANAEPHHFGEFNVTKPDGGRYIYGIPAYNSTQVEASFNVGKATDNGDGLVSYQPFIDNSTNNKKGFSHFYQKTTTPAYAHSFLLTAVLSSDYQDFDDVRGPSLNDLGTYVKFDYGGEPAINSYRWRVPYEENKANFNQGFRSLDSDNKGSYVYGEKEVWYLEKIETKTHVAIFHLSDRRDGYEVRNENGGFDGATCRSLRKLDKITLYAKPDYDENGLDAVPIKTVHFEYDYTLCGNVPNNDGASEMINGVNVNSKKGKLTLKKIYFTYGNSNRGRLSAYNFNYETNNPDYDLKKYDMWGTFKDYGTQASNNAEFPYVNQYESRATHDSYASAWSLNRISLPSGGEINIEYESDDYAYVQDRHATQLLEIVNATKTPSLSSVVNTGNTIELFDQNDDPNLYLWFRLIGEDANGIAADDFKTKYLDKLHHKGDKLYFYCLSDLDKGNEEFISGYAEVEGENYYGVNLVGSEYYGYVKLKGVDRENKKNSTSENSHPIAKAAWQFVRLYLPQLLSTAGKNVDDDMDYTSILQAMATWPIGELFKGPNKIVKDKGIGNGIISGKSWARLAAPNGKKIGGGVRVKSVQIADAWDAMTSNGEERSYGQEYLYELETGESSGVATFEPLISKENPFVEPVFFDVRKWMIPNDQHMLEKPYGASFFPAPQVTYSRVVSRTLYPEFNEGGTDYVTPINRRTGYTETNFYTSRDFPTKVRQTDLDTKPVIGNSQILQLLKVVVVENHTVSQGYMVETNDMNGKIKSTFTYNEGGNMISGNEYKYFSNGDRLANSVLTVNKDGSLENRDIGVEFDVFNDFNKYTSLNVSGGINANVGAFMAAVLPIPYVALFPVATFERTSFRSTATFKTVNRVGILKEVIAYQDGASVSTENMAWDAETGEVLLTRTKNQFDDLVYNYSFPSHWAYDRMGQAYKNIGLKISNFQYQQPGVFEAQQAGQVDHYVPGDEVLLTSFTTQFGPFFDLNPASLNPTKKAWVLDVNPATKRLTLIDKEGELLDDTGLNNYIAIKVIKSGRKNQQSLSIGSLLMKQNPINETTMEITNDRLSSLENDIIDAGVAEYSDHWSVQRGVVGECVATATNAGDALITFLNALIDNNHLGDGSVFSSVNVSSFPDFSDLFDAFQLCGSDFQNCSNLEAINIWDADPTKFAVHFNCIGEPDCSGQTGCQVPLIDNGGVLDGTINFTNVESFELNPNANGLEGLVIGKWGDLEVVFDLYSDCLDFEGFTDCSTPRNCGFEAGAVINPFVTNLRGNFRSFRTWVKLGERKQMTGPGQNVDQRTQGAYEDFVFFWQNPGNGADWEATPDSDNDGNDDWTWVNSVTFNAGYNENGIQQENKDALYRYSSAIHGYQDKLPIAVAANATKSQIGFDGFEDYGFYDYDGCPERHFAFDSYKHLLTDETSHTGTYSIALESAAEISMTRELAAKPCDFANYGFPNAENPYLLSECEMYNLFGPETFDRAAYEKSVHLGETPVEVEKDQKYVISYWVKKDELNPGDDDFSGVLPVVTADQSTVTLSNQRLSPVIDGWQKIEYTFEIPGIDPAVATEHPISVGFTNNTGDLMFIDDVRIQPFNSEMTTYVYDPSNFRLVAELDGNNFATFYEYDNEGKLLRIKKETERGIMTIQESREHIVPTNID